MDYGETLQKGDPFVQVRNWPKPHSTVWFVI